MSHEMSCLLNAHGNPPAWPETVAMHPPGRGGWTGACFRPAVAPTAISTACLSLATPPIPTKTAKNRKAHCKHLRRIRSRNPHRPPARAPPERHRTTGTPDSSGVPIGIAISRTMRGCFPRSPSGGEGWGEGEVAWKSEGRGPKEGRVPKSEDRNPRPRAIRVSAFFRPSFGLLSAFDLRI